MLEISAQARPQVQPIHAQDEGRLGFINGRIARRRGGSTNALRWALYVTHEVGRTERLSNTFAADLDRDGVAALLRQHRLTLHADNTVGAYAPSVALDPQKIAAAQATHDAVKATFADARRAVA